MARRPDRREAEMSGRETSRNYKPVRLDPRQHFSCIRHAGEVRHDVDRVGDEQGDDERRKAANLEIAA